MGAIFITKMFEVVYARVSLISCETGDKPEGRHIYGHTRLLCIARLLQIKIKSDSLRIRL